MIEVAKVKLWARTADIQKYIKHPSGAGFGPDGIAHWPDDQFTARRIADGDVTTIDPSKPKPREQR